MAHFATALARGDGEWTGRELDLDDFGDLDSLVDALRDLSQGGDPVVLFVEEDDEWFGIVRVDGDAEPRVFVSDVRVVGQSEIAALLFEGAPAVAVPDDDEESTLRPEGEPAGEVDVVADLGTPPDALLELCGEEGLLPSDIISTLCDKAGCTETLEELRGTAP